MVKLAVILALPILGACNSAGIPVESGSVADPQRGALLYDTACSACHTTQPHWREKPVVNSWDELLRQVSGWQSVAGQNWRPDEVRDVAAYLNRRFYRLPCPVAGCSFTNGT
jgi:hypothetical protein